MLVAWCAYY